MKERSEIPKGFVRKELRVIKAEMLMPETWFFNHEVQLGTNAYFLTKENLKKRGIYRVGATVQAMNHVKRRMGMSSIDLLNRMGSINIVKELNVTYEEPKIEEDETFISLTRLAKADMKKGGSVPVFDRANEVELIAPEKISQFMHVTANKKTDTFYTTIFESPESTWEVYRDTGNIMIESLRFDPTI